MLARGTRRTMAWLTKTLQASPVHHQYYRPTGNIYTSSDYSPSSGTDSDSDAGGACGTSGTNCNTGGTGGVWVHGRLRSSTRMRMLQDTKATIYKNTGNANVTIWMEEDLTMRHIRLALEDNCTPCTRHPNLTLDGGAHSLTPALEPDFTTCCL